MSVSLYDNRRKGYRLDRLDKVVYLLSKSHGKNIVIDGGDAYIAEIGEVPTLLEVTSVSIEETEELDERYAFTHTLRFTVDGYRSLEDLGEEYYAMVRTMDGDVYFLNPRIPCKVTYTYTLDDGGSRTEFVMAIRSNHPMLVADTEAISRARTCKPYMMCAIDKLRLNEARFSRSNQGEVTYTNDGFKDVYPRRRSASFTETFDGNAVEHSLQFAIDLSSYKASWHYNLLEFADNLYSAIIGTTCGSYVLAGFGFGLHPQFTIGGSDSTNPNLITIVLSDRHDNLDLLTFTDNVVERYDGTTTYEFTDKHHNQACTKSGYATHTLKEKVDAFGNPLGSYLVLEGYEERFPTLEIDGTFSVGDEFPSDECKNECRIDTDLPTSLIFHDSNPQSYYIETDSDWSIQHTTNISISPQSGIGGQRQTITITPTVEVGDEAVYAKLTVAYCDTEKAYRARLIKDYGCWPYGSSIRVSANEQYAGIPTTCCFSKVVNEEGVVTDITIQEGYIRVFVPRNDSGSNRTFTFNAQYCDGLWDEFVVIQSSTFERWAVEDYVCDNFQRCDVQRLYTATTYDGAYSQTDTTRVTNCVESELCSKRVTRWRQTSETRCSGNRKYYVEVEEYYVEGSGGQGTWVESGRTRFGARVDGGASDCTASTVDYEYRWVSTTKTACQGNNKYFLYKQQRRRRGTSDAWVDSVPSVLSYNGNGSMTPNIAIENSSDCGYVKPTGEPIYKLVEVQGDFICDECEGPAPIVKWVATIRDTATISGSSEPLSTINSGEVPSDSRFVEALKIVTSIGNSAFEGLDYLDGVRLPSGLLSIGASAFRDCTVLSGVTIPSGVTNIGSRAFQNCSGLTSVNIPSGVTNIREMTFYNCQKLTSVNITDSVTSIDNNAFYNCRNLTSFDIPSGVTSIGGSAFSKCSSLQSINIPSGLTFIGNSIFRECLGLTAVTIPSNSKLTTIGESVFQGCTSLQSINIPNSVTKISFLAFAQCFSLTSITIPSSVTNIEDYAFYMCEGLQSVTVNAVTPPTLGDSVFYDTYCPILVPSQSLDTYKSASGWSTYASRIQGF